MPLVSVILPAYNAEKTIAETIQSVLQQTWTDFELLVINDGSTDATVDIVSQIHDVRIQILTFANAGVVASRNRGLEKATGEWITFIDADDLWTPDKLACQLKALTHHPEAAVAYSWTDYIDQAGQFVRPGWHDSPSGNVYAAMVNRCFIENGSNILFRRSVLSEVEGFDPSLVMCEDWDFYIRLAEKFQFICVPQPQVLYRLSIESQSTQLLQMEKDGVEVLRRVEERSPGETHPNLRQVIRNSLATFYSYLVYKAVIGPPGRYHRWLGIQILCRGILRSPKTFQYVAKRHIAQLIRSFVLGT